MGRVHGGNGEKEKIKIMKKITILFILLFVLVILYTFVVALGFMPNKDTVTLPESSADVVEYFWQQMQNKFITEVGQPIEGFEPQMFVQLYSGLVPQDFDEVEALLGTYKVSGGEIAFMVEEGGVLHSAAQAISPHGMYTLLMNISSRLTLPINTKEDIDVILSRISNEETGEIQSEITITAELDERVAVLGAFITPLEVLEDSRCPSGAECIWEGTVRLSVRVESGLGTASMDIESNNPVTTETEEIELIGVLPTAILNAEILDEEYSFTFLVKKR